MKKLIILCLSSIIFLTSCVQIKKIDYTSYSTSFEQTNQDIYSNTLDNVYFSSVNINSVQDFDKYVTQLNNLSISSYESVKNADYLSYEDIEREIKFQENIITLLKKLTISEDFFYSKDEFEYAKIYKDTNIPNIITARINYFETLATDIDLSSVSTESKLSHIDNGTLPLLNVDAETTRNKFLGNF